MTRARREELISSGINKSRVSGECILGSVSSTKFPLKTLLKNTFNHKTMTSWCMVILDLFLTSALLLASSTTHPSIPMLIHTL